jgi:multiple sugar transport system permease protein
MRELDTRPGETSPPNPLSGAERGLGGEVSRRIGQALVFVLVAGWSALAVLPLVWMVTTSFKPTDQIFTFPPRWIPEPVVFRHYLVILDNSPFPRFFLNSAIVAIATTVGQAASSAMAAFAFARLRFPGRDVLFLLFLSTLMVPEQVTYIPLFMVAKYLNLVDSYAGLILPAIVTPFGIFLLRQAFLGIPSELEDAARIDGCGSWGVLWRVFLPVARPALATAALFAFLGSWNAYFWPLIVTQSTAMRTVPVGLRYFLRDPQLGTDWGALMAASTLVLLPAIALFVATQRQFLQGLLAGSLKG